MRSAVMGLVVAAAVGGLSAAAYAQVVTKPLHQGGTTEGAVALPAQGSGALPQSGVAGSSGATSGLASGGSVVTSGAKSDVKASK
jgi:hypothetical protein